MTSSIRPRSSSQIKEAVEDQQKVKRPRVEEDFETSDEKDTPSPDRKGVGIASDTKPAEGEDQSESKEVEGDAVASNHEAVSSSDGAGASTVVTAAAVSASDWQAIWAPQVNAYYFFNNKTQESTWTNPLVPNADGDAGLPTSAEPPVAGPSSTTPQPQQLAIPDAALNGIDPALAYLDPTLYGTRPDGAPPNTFTAKFNARTGRFTSDNRDPSYMSEYERAKRMSSVFFDVEAWEKQIAERNAKAEEEAEQKKARPSKKDMERWKEAKKKKKLAKHAWLRN